MAKETTKKTGKKASAPAKEKEPKKNPLLDADEDTDTDEVEEETTDEDTSDEEVDEEAEDSEDDEVEEEEAPKKVAKPKAPVAPAKVNVADEAASDVRTTKQILDAEEKVHFMIPLFEGEKPGAVHECFINGYRVPVKKGVMTMVPRSIAEMLAEHYKINTEAGADYRLDQHPERDVDQSA